MCIFCGFILDNVTRSNCYSHGSYRYNKVTFFFGIHESQSLLIKHGNIYNNPDHNLSFGFASNRILSGRCFAKIGLGNDLLCWVLNFEYRPTVWSRGMWICFYLNNLVKIMVHIHAPWIRCILSLINLDSKRVIGLFRWIQRKYDLTRCKKVLLLLRSPQPPHPPILAT